MKFTHTLIALILLCPFAGAQEELAPILPEVKLDRAVHGYAESTTKPATAPKRPLVAVTPIKVSAVKPLETLHPNDLQKAMVSALDPEFGFFNLPTDLKKLEKAEKSTLVDVMRKGNANKPPMVAKTKPLSPFRVKLLLQWDPPHGEMMATLLKRIETAEAVGDEDAYQRYTTTYTAWAEKYLRREAKPDNKQK